MANQHGDFIWYELLTNDADAAARFYGAVIGWQNRAAEGSDRGYRIFGIGGADVGGLMPFPAGAESAGMRPIWLGYVAVENVDAAAADIVRDGGTQHMPPTDIPGVGRFAMLADPQGVMFYVMRGAMDGTSTAFDQSKFGHCNWNELSTSDPAGGARLLHGPASAGRRATPCPWARWATTSSSPISGQTIGAVMRRTPDGPPPGMDLLFRRRGYRCRRAGRVRQWRHDPLRPRRGAGRRLHHRRQRPAGSPVRPRRSAQIREAIVRGAFHVRQRLFPPKNSRAARRCAFRTRAPSTAPPARPCWRRRSSCGAIWSVSPPSAAPCRPAAR